MPARRCDSRAAVAGSRSRVRDYRQATGRHDIILSVEMVEATGEPYAAPGAGPAAAARGAVVVLHGGQSVSTRLTSPVQPSVLRMVPLARAVRHALRGTGVVVSRPRFRLRGWNGEEASPVDDLSELLNEMSGRLGSVPVVLIGHSMGARAALRAAGHPLVSAVIALAPWLPPGEPVLQLAGRRILLAHASADRVVSPDWTWAYAERARSVGPVTEIEVRGADHAMLRRARLWHRLAAEFACLSLALPVRAGQASGALGRTGTAQQHQLI